MHTEMQVLPITLSGSYVRLEPLSMEHHASLCEVAFDDDLWNLTMTVMKTPDDLSAYMRTALQWQEEGTALPFAIIEAGTGKAIGSTQFGNIDKANRRLEIGWTWIARQWQRTAVNTEMKYLLLTHAFESMGCIRVEFKTDSLNMRSRNAMTRIGAKEEGTFRNHMITPSGRIRHSVYFSIVREEWNEVKEKLAAKLRTY